MFLSHGLDYPRGWAWNMHRTRRSNQAGACSWQQVSWLHPAREGGHRAWPGDRRNSEQTGGADGRVCVLTPACTLSLCLSRTHTHTRCTPTQANTHANTQTCTQEHACTLWTGRFPQPSLVLQVFSRTQVTCCGHCFSLYELLMGSDRLLAQVPSKVCSKDGWMGEKMMWGWMKAVMGAPLLSPHDFI